jgi:SAM-dependent methyltransferase
MRKRIARLLRALGLMPLVHQLRMWLSPLEPGTLRRNVARLVSGEREPLPLPSFKARFLVAGSADVEGFLEFGRLGARTVREAVERRGRTLEQCSPLLDFGCGCGRVLRHWHGLPEVEVHGTEMNEYLVEESRRCVPFARVGLNRAAPPLAYADGQFGLIYAFSVFTHLNDELQKGWRDELRRILRPGGLLLVTTHGEPYVARLDEAERAAYREGRCVVQGGEYEGANMCTTYHPESYVRETLAVGFEVVDYVPQGALGNPVQDLWVLQRV